MKPGPDNTPGGHEFFSDKRTAAISVLMASLISAIGAATYFALF